MFIDLMRRENLQAPKERNIPTFGLVTLRQFADQREQRQVHRDDDAPMVTPRKPIKAGSIKVSRLAIAESTSCS